MYEIILTVCVFANAYSTDLACEKQTLSELPSCASVVIDQKPGVMIKGVECKKMVPVAPAPKVGEKNA
jgi:hypothetical protein